MSIDTFTLSAMAVVLLVLVALVWAVLRAGRVDRETLDQLQNQLHDVSSATGGPSSAARELCRAIRCLYPNALNGVDFSVLDGDDGAYIAEWELPVSRPDKAQLQQAMLECRSARESSHLYREQRAHAYPPIGDQLDALYKARHGDSSELEVIDQQIADVKNRYPNPDEVC